MNYKQNDDCRIEFLNALERAPLALQDSEIELIESIGRRATLDDQQRAAIDKLAQKYAHRVRL